VNNMSNQMKFMVLLGLSFAVVIFVLAKAKETQVAPTI